jgi:hypothetical protein
MTDRAWSARELCDRLDALSGTKVFSELYDQHVSSSAFPDLAQTYGALGITTSSGSVALSSEPGGRQLRDAIMTHREQ